MSLVRVTVGSMRAIRRFLMLIVVVGLIGLNLATLLVGSVFDALSAVAESVLPDRTVAGRHRAAVADLASDLDAERARGRVLAQDAAAQRRRLDGLADDLDAKGLRIAQAEADIAAGRARIDDLQRDLSAERASATDLRADLETERAATARARSDLVGERVALETAEEELVTARRRSAEVDRISRGVLRRAVRTSLRAPSALLASSLPVVGTGVDLAATVADLNDACAMARDMAGLRTEMGLAESSDVAIVCTATDLLPTLDDLTRDELPPCEVILQGTDLPPGTCPPLSPPGVPDVPGREFDALPPA